MMDHNKKLYNVIYVLDRIVTYKTAAAILNLDVHEAKVVLKKFVENLREKNETVGVTCVVGGTTCDKHKLIIVPEHKYEKTKAFFDNVTIDHIYSVQKSEFIDWASVFNVDDLLYEDKNVDVKKEIQTDTEIEIVRPKEIAKKGSINNFFSQSGKDIKKESISIKQEHDVKKEKNGTSKSAKSSFMSNFISKANKENLANESNKSNKIDTVATNSVINDEANDDDDEIGVKRSKKRARVINDDDDLPESKSPKIDILDDECDAEEKIENRDDSTIDIFGSPEKDADLSDEEIIKIEDTDIETQGCKNTQTETDTSEQMYEDDEGFFVTEKTPVSKKRKLEKVPEQLKDTKTQEEKKEEKQIKKQLTQKLKKDTNQKTLFNFFKKN